MLIDFLSTDTYGMYNIDLANIIGLHEAIYVNNLINIYKKAITKKKLHGDFILIDREYITSVTTFTVAEQKEMDKKLQDVNILHINIDNKDLVKLNLSNITTLLVTDNEELVTDVKTKTTKKKRTKAEAIKDNLKNLITVNNDELRKAYEDWIDAVYAKQGWMSAKCVTVGQNQLDTFANHNLDVALDILNIASIHGYRDMQWAIENYNKSMTAKPVNAVRFNSTPTKVVNKIEGEVY